MSDSGNKTETSTKRVGLISLGCAKNRVDSEIMLGELRRQGYEIVDEIDEADTVVVNTCGFVGEAKEESIEALLEVADRKSQSGKSEGGEASGVDKLLVAGCMVNRYGDQLAREIPEIDGFIGLDDLQRVSDLVQLGGGPPPPGPSHLVFDHTAPRMLTTGGYAFLKVAEGCNNPCTFCAIPQWRGRFRSRTIESLVAEAQSLEKQGAQEICLIAQDTTRFGEDLELGRGGLLQLIESLLQETSIPWIRFLYAYPTTLDRRLFDLMAAEPRFLSYLDIPLQHSHPEILRRMQRGGSGDQYRAMLEEARAKVPDLFLRSTFIAGFPGEEEEHFEHLLDFVQAIEFDHLGGFVYSPEPGTPGAELDRAVPSHVARRRHEKLLAAQRPISEQRRQALVGQVLPTLVEGVCRETDHLLEGRHYGMAPEVDGRLLINDGVAPGGALVDVEITDAFADDLVGRIVGPKGMPSIQLAEPIEGHV